MIISVWGNSGAGTSTLAIKLALEFSQKKKNVILIDTNYIAPQAGIWFPKERIENTQSLATILSNNVETEIVARKLVMVNKYFGYLGYGHDMSINAIPTREDTAVELLKKMNDLADVVIVDCQPNITQDVLSFLAVDIADTKIINMTPDLRGLAWYDANVMMMKEKWEAQEAQIIKIFNQVHKHSPTDAIEPNVGTVQFFLPYYIEIGEQLYTGTLGELKYKGSSKRYGAIVATICENILEYYAANPIEETLGYAPTDELDVVESEYENQYLELSGEVESNDNEIVVIEEIKEGEDG